MRVPRIPTRVLRLVLALVVTAVALPATASAVRVTQHVVSGSPAGAIFVGPQGLLVAGVSSSSAYSTVVPSPSFALKNGPGGLGALSFFLGPDGQTWIIGGVNKAGAEGKSETFPTLEEITGTTLTNRFTFPTAFGKPDSPLTAVSDAEGNIWVSDPNAGGVERYGTDGNLTLFPFSTSPFQLVFGPAKDVWSTDVVGGGIGQITNEGVATQLEIGGPGFGSFHNTQPYGLIVGPDGAMWFAESNGAAIGRITEAGEVQTFPIPETPGAGRPSPRFLATGPEGAIWFTDAGDNSIGRVQNGQVTEYPIPTTAPVVPGAIVDDGGELWFTEAAVAGLGSVNPTLTPLPTPTLPTISTTEVLAGLKVSGNAAKIKALLKASGYTAGIKLAVAGRESIVWTAKGRIVASGETTLSASGSGKLKIKLTAAGKQLLKKSKSLKLTATAEATPTTGLSVTASKALTVKR